MLRRYGWLGLGFVVVGGVAVDADVLFGSGGAGSAAARPPQDFDAAASPVPTNRVTGSGTATLQLRGDTATVTVRTTGLLGGSPHLMHIHAKGLGNCPPASAARLHNGHLSISTADGLRYYGRPITSLTEWGSTSGNVPTNINMNLYPATGNIRYSRTVTLVPGLADLIRRGDAVIVVHGIDYNNNHIYDFKTLGLSDLDKTLPGEATAPEAVRAIRSVPAHRIRRGTIRAWFGHDHICRFAGAQRRLIDRPTSTTPFVLLSYRHVQRDCDWITRLTRLADPAPCMTVHVLDHGHPPNLLQRRSRARRTTC